MKEYAFKKTIEEIINGWINKITNKHNHHKIKGYTMKLSHFSLALLLGLFMTIFALAQTHIHEHSKIDMSSDTSHAKDTTRAIVKTKYTCPMHPEVISDKPGKCPKCGMTLVKVKSSSIIKKSHKMEKDTTMSHPDMMH
jgi:hypothetical protein